MRTFGKALFTAPDEAIDEEAWSRLAGPTLPGRGKRGSLGASGPRVWSGNTACVGSPEKKLFPSRVKMGPAIAVSLELLQEQ